MSKQTSVKTELTQEQKMLRGTAWSTGSNVVSRLLGVIYIIPWFAWLGEHANEANALFNMGYNTYSLLLSLSTVGLNVAMAKLVSKYNAMGREDISIKLLREFIKIMSLVGALVALGLWLAAPWIAKGSGDVTELVPVLRSLSWAILIFPAMSVVRGYFQGLNDLKPTAIGQIYEQIVRIIWILLATFMIMKLGSGDYKVAVVQSTFAAFVGMVASVLVLVYYLWQMGLMQKLFKSDKTELDVRTRDILFEAVREAVPFVITGTAAQLYTYVDQFTFIKSMEAWTRLPKDELLVMYSYFSANPQKITMIILSVATSIGAVSIALLTENFVKQDRRASAKLVIGNLNMLALFILPATIGASLVAKSLYTIFYGVPDALALGLFVVAMLQVVILGAYQVLAPMLQALFENRLAVRYSLYGLAVKILVQLPLIYVFKGYGPLLATNIGFAVSIYLMYRRIHAITRFNRRAVIKKAVLISLMILFMALFVALTEWGLNAILPVTGKGVSLVHLLLSGGVGVLVYGYLALRTHLIDMIIGARADQLRHKLHIK